MTIFHWLLVLFVGTAGTIIAVFKKYYMPPETPTPPPQPPPVPPQPPPQYPDARVQPPEPPVDRIRLCALAQQQFEGWFVGSTAYRHNNPGNCKDMHGEFITFRTYLAGLAYLEDYIRRVASGQHKAYPKGGATTIMEYTHIYTSDAEPSPTNYAHAIALAVGLPTTAPMSALLE